MKYDISSTKAPKMPKLGKGTECLKILLSKVSKDMRETLLPMAIPALSAHTKDISDWTRMVKTHENVFTALLQNNENRFLFGFLV